MLNASRHPDAFGDGAELEIRIRVESADGRFPIQVLRIDQLLPGDEPEPGNVHEVTVFLKSELEDLRALRIEREQRAQRRFAEKLKLQEQQLEWRRLSEEKRATR